MKKVKICLLATVLLFMMTLNGAFADAKQLEFGMTKEEVVTIMGKGSDVLNKQFESNYDILAYPGQKVSKYTDAILVLYFDDGKLASKMYSFEEESTLRTENKYGYLLNALTGKYGEPEAEADIKLLCNFFEMFSGKKVKEDTADLLIKTHYAVIKTWTINDDTTILLVNVINTNADGALTAIQYTPKNITMAETTYNDDGL